MIFSILVTVAILVLALAVRRIDRKLGEALEAIRELDN